MSVQGPFFYPPAGATPWSKGTQQPAMTPGAEYTQQLRFGETLPNFTYQNSDYAILSQDENNKQVANWKLGEFIRRFNPTVDLKSISIDTPAAIEALLAIP